MSTKDKQEKLRKKKLETLKAVKKIFFTATPQTLRRKSYDESIFTKRFLCLLIKELGKPGDFLKKNAAERRKLAHKINDLFLVENDWSALISKTKYEENISMLNQNRKI